MREKEFTTRIHKIFKEQGAWIWKIRDDGFQNPFDAVGCYKGLPLALEYKYLPSPKAFPLTRLEDHQMQNLKEHWLCGGWSALVIGVCYGRNDVRVFVYANEQLPMIEQRKKDRQNILRKEFDSSSYMKLSEINLDSFLQFRTKNFIIDM